MCQRTFFRSSMKLNNEELHYKISLGTIFQYLPVVVSASHDILALLLLDSEPLDGVGSSEGEGVITRVLVAVSDQETSNISI